MKKLINIVALSLLLFSCAKYEVGHKLKQLKHGTEKQRVQAARTLANYQDKRVVPGLAKALDDNSYMVRLHGMVSLFNIEKQKSIPLLVTRLKDEKAVVRKFAATLLGWVGNREAVPALIALLNDNESIVRVSAIKALAALKDKRATPHLLLRLTQCTDSEIKPIVDSLVLSRGSRFTTLIAAYKRCNAAKRSYILEALGMLEDKRVVPFLLQVFPSADSLDSEKIIGILGSIRDKRAVPLLLRVASKESKLQKKAIETLAKFKGKQIIYKLRSLLNTYDWRLRKLIIETIAKISGKERYPILVNALKDVVDYVKIAAINGLGLVKEKKAIPLLIPFLQAKTSDLRTAAANALGEIKAKSAVPALINAYKKSSWGRLQIVFALGRINSKKAKTFLISLINEPDEDVSKVAQIFVDAPDGVNKYQTLIDMLREDRYTRDIFVNEIILNSGNIQYRNALVRQLILKLKDKDLAEKLIKTYQKSKSWRKLEIIVLLGELKDKRATDFLLKLFTATKKLDTQAVVYDKRSHYLPTHIISYFIAHTSNNSRDSNLLLVKEKHNKKIVIQRLIIKALAKIGNRKAIQPLLLHANSSVFNRDMSYGAIRKICGYSYFK